MDKNTVSISNPVELDEGQLTNIKLVTPQSQHYQTLLNWFTHKAQFEQWAGPSIPFPCESSDIESALHNNRYKSYALVNTRADGEQTFLGFGQIQIWPKRAHLGRLVIAPEHRRKSLSYVLVNMLIQEAEAFDITETVSLFVYNSNVSAVKSYHNLGFVKSPYPKGVSLVQNCSFMTLTL
jgi:ribosomal protein S18 acetylase RimI-like enzyme